MTRRGTRTTGVGLTLAWVCLCAILDPTARALASPASPASPLPGWQRLTGAGEGVVALVAAIDGTIAALAAPVPGTELQIGRAHV